MKIDLTVIENDPLDFAEVLQVPAERLDPARSTGGVEVSLRGNVARNERGFWAQGEVSYHGNLLCTRCLEPVEWQLTESFGLQLCVSEPLPPGEEVELAEEDLDVVFLESESLDLAELAAEQVLLALPMRILCHEECAGLCPRCGGNRNVQGGCTCEDESDPRWGVLRGMRGRLGNG